VEVKEI